MYLRGACFTIACVEKHEWKLLRGAGETHGGAGAQNSGVGGLGESRSSSSGRVHEQQRLFGTGLDCALDALFCSVKEPPAIKVLV